MNEKMFGRSVAEQLNRGLTRLDRDVLDRLAKARESALDAYREPAYAKEFVYAAEGFGLGWGAVPRLGYLLPVMLLVASLALAFSWQNIPEQSPAGADVADVDAGLLSSELPLQAYLDNDLDQWLDNTSEQ